MTYEQLAELRRRGLHGRPTRKRRRRAQDPPPEYDTMYSRQVQACLRDGTLLRSDCEVCLTLSLFCLKHLEPCNPETCRRDNEAPIPPATESITPLTETIYICRECGLIFHGHGRDLPCGHTNYSYYSVTALGDILRILQTNIVCWRARSCDPEQCHPECRAVERAIAHFLRGMRVL